MYAVIFKTKRNLPVPADYVDMNKQLVESVSEMDDFLGVESIGNDQGEGISISYWASLEAISDWKKQSLHLDAQKQGKEKWYEYYSVEVCEILRSYDSHTNKDLTEVINTDTH